MTKRKLTKRQDDIRRGLTTPQPYDGIHTCSKGCKKAGCNRGLRETIEEQNAQIEGLKRDLLEKTAAVRSQFANSEQENARLNNYIERLEVRNAELVPENAHLKAQVARLTSDLQMEKENKDRLVREWQKANNEVYGLQTQVAALIDDQTRLKAEVERLRKAGDALARIVEPPYDHMKKDEYSMWAAEIDAMNRWNAAKEGKPSV